MDDLATQLSHAPQRRPEIVHLKIRQRVRVPGSLAPLVHADRWSAARGLPALALVARSVDEVDAQHSGPEAPSAIRIVGRKLDQLQRHAHNYTIRPGYAFPSTEAIVLQRASSGEPMVCFDELKEMAAAYE
jgi:hypothetical protein